MNFLNNGGNLYIENVDLGKDYSGTEFFESLGLEYIDDGGEHEVATIFGGNDCITSDLELSYFGGESPHYSADRLDSDVAQMLFCCENDFGRMFLYETENYKAVSSSMVLGAIANGDTLNLKPYIISEMVNYFMGYDPYTSVGENLSGLCSGKSFPNPFTYNTTISYAIGKTGRVRVKVYNTNGQMIRKLVDQELTSGDYSVSWDATNENGDPVKGGFYFYKITVGDFSSTEKMMLVR
jgi:hypothetical protein